MERSKYLIQGIQMSFSHKHVYIMTKCKQNAILPSIHARIWNQIPRPDGETHADVSSGSINASPLDFPKRRGEMAVAAVPHAKIIFYIHYISYPVNYTW